MKTYSTHYPHIVRVKHDKPTGKFRCATDEYIIGYVSRGMYCLYDYYAGRRIEVRAGYVYMLSVGDHICEAFPDGEGCFEQIVFKFTSDDLKTVVMGLSVGGEEDSVIENMTLLSRCLYVVKQADESIHLLFRSLDTLHGECSRTDNYIRLSLIVYFMTNSDDGLLRSELSDGKSIDNSKFEREVYANIYTNLSLEEIASKCCLSVSSFKRRFSRRFNTSPHRWFLEKRMCRAHGMLITTDMSISEIGRACGFFNQSHFIKVFKCHYGMTPTLYRRKYADNLSERIPSHGDNRLASHGDNRGVARFDNRSAEYYDNMETVHADNKSASHDENMSDLHADNMGVARPDNRSAAYYDNRETVHVDNKSASHDENVSDLHADNMAAAER